MTGPIVIGRLPARIDIAVNAGEPVDFTVPVLDAAGAAQSLSGWTVTATVHRDTTTLHTFTTAVVSASQVQVTAAGVDTAGWSSWPVSAAQWSLWLTPPASEPYLFAAGWVRVATY